MRFVSVLYISYPNIIALKSIFDSSDVETKSDKGDHVLAILKSNNWCVKTFSLHIFCPSSNQYLNRERGKNGANLKLFKNHFQNGVLLKSQIVIRIIPAGDVQIQEKKRKWIGIGCGQQTSKYLTDKISDQTFNSHVNIIF